MNTRDTSIDAFRSVQPQLSEKHTIVLTLLKGSHALTNSEIARHLDLPINTITPRTNELVKYGLVQAFGKRQCRVTGRRAYAWGIATDRPTAEPVVKCVPISVLIDGIRVTRFVPDPSV